MSKAATPDPRGQTPYPRIQEFVRTLAPFDTLGAEELTQVVERMEVAYYPRGTVVIAQGGEPSRYLYLIQAGSAKVTLQQAEGEEILVDIRGEGDTFGAVSLLQGSRALFEVSAREDLICYLLPGDAFQALVEAHPAFERHFRFSLARNLEAVRKGADQACQVQAAGLMGASLDAAMVRSRVGEVMVREVLTCLPATTVRAAAHRMGLKQVGSIFVVDEGGHPLGVVTDYDLRIKVVAQGQGPNLPVAEIMSQPVHAVAPDQYAFEALLTMSSHGVHHLAVVEADRLVGVISDHDFQMLAGSSPVGVVREIDKVASVGDLVRLHAKIDRVLELLLRMGGAAQTMLGLVSEFNDRVTIKLLELIESEVEHAGLGRPPVPYVWMALGSEGRREQTLRTDQDNAIIFANLPPEREQGIKDWFLMFAERVVGGLERCGFPRCLGGVMASNPQWCLTERGWQQTFERWLTDPTPLTLRLATIFFDFRSIYAEADFIDSLSLRLKELIEANRLFLRYMAKNALYNRPPLGFLRQFVVEKGGDHKNMLNLKLSGLTPIVDAARVMALDLGALKTNTLERLEEIAQAGLIAKDMAADLREAFSFITVLRIQAHLEARARGEAPDNFVDPAQLNKLQRKMLKESFGVISKLQDLMEYRYQTRAVPG